MWTPNLGKSPGPLYLAIADAIAADIASGRLTTGQKLPPQRTLAQALGVDFTTVTRAYQEAGRRGLVDGRVGQGTFVQKKPTTQARAEPAGLVDMSMNLPPIPEDDQLAQRMWSSFSNLQGPEATRLMLRYQEPGGSLRDRQAGLAWLQGRAGELDVARILIAPGAQGALTAVTTSLAKRGDVVLVEPLSYPGFLSLAAHLGIRLEPVEVDEEGPLPDALEKAIKTFDPKAFYCTPTLHNPTTRSWSETRRAEVASIAARAGLAIIEDDAYGALPDRPMPTLAQVGGAQVYHVASLSKCLAPALRIAYVIAPDATKALKLAGSLRGTTAMASPLTAALATNWIESGMATEFLGALKTESRQRQAVARRLLPDNLVRADPEGFHIWLTLPPGWARGDFVSRLRAMGVAAVGSDAFAVAPPPEAVRLGLGGAVSRSDLERSISTIAGLLADTPAMTSFVV